MNKIKELEEIGIELRILEVKNNDGKNKRRIRRI